MLELKSNPDQIINQLIEGETSIPAILKEMGLSFENDEQAQPTEEQHKMSEAVILSVYQHLNNTRERISNLTKRVVENFQNDAQSASTVKFLRWNLEQCLIFLFKEIDAEEIKDCETKQDAQNAKRLQRLCSFLGLKFEQFSGDFPEELSRDAHDAKPPELYSTPERGKLMMVKITIDPVRIIYVSFRGDSLFAVDYSIGSKRQSGNHDMSMSELTKLISNIING